MKYMFLALLAYQPTHGYDLLQTYQKLFADIRPPLNAGQISTTLARLERDGLVNPFEVEQSGKPDKKVYQLSDQGRRVLNDWFTQPINGHLIKNTFYLKLISAQMTGLVSSQELIKAQRQQFLQSLHDLNLLLVQPEIAADPAKQLLVQGAVLHLRADLEWLALCEDIFS